MLRNVVLMWVEQVRKTIRPTTLRPSLQPGAVLIILAGRFRGKRVVYLKPLTNGVLLVTGPFKVNGVPLRRVNSRYVIATSTTVDLTGVNVDKFDDKYFAREKEAKKTKEEKLFKGDTVTVRYYQVRKLQMRPETDLEFIESTEERDP